MSPYPARYLIARVCIAFAALLALVQTDALGQPGNAPAIPVRSGPDNNLTKFDLQFPGGTPGEMLSAIQKAMGRPINAIVPDDLASLKLPPVKMRNVTVPQLFEALKIASAKTERIANGMNNYTMFQSSYGFRTQGQTTDDSIWAFYYEKPFIPEPAHACRFYSLAPFLEAGFTVDDITTAIETGWKMLGLESTATIKFHKDTKLLIAVGEPGKLEIIDAVLKALDRPKPNPAPFPGKPVPKSTEKP